MKRRYRLSICGRDYGERLLDCEGVEKLLVTLAEQGHDFAVLTPIPEVPCKTK